MYGSNAPLIEIIFEDSKTDPKSGLAAYQKLKNEGVRLYLTTVSSIAMAIAPAIKQDSALLFADVAYPGITGENSLLFRHSSTAEQEAQLIFAHLSTSAVHAIGLLWNNDDYGSAFEKELRQLYAGNSDAKIKSTSFAKTDSDLRAEVLQILQSTPEVVVVAGFGKALGLAVRRLREADYKGEIVASMGFTVTPDAAITAGDAARGVLYASMDIDGSDAQYQEFSRVYKEHFDSVPPTFAALSYNSTKLLIDAALQSNGDPQATAANIRTRQTFRGAGESMTIMPTGDILPPIILIRYTDGSFQ